MAVLSWKRTISKTEYLRRIYELNKDLSRIVGKIPKKYARNYGDWLIKTGLDALCLAQKANRIFIVSKDTYAKRRAYLNDVRGCLDSISTVSFLVLQLLRDSNAGYKELQDGTIVPTNMGEKITRWEDKIGTSCDEIHEMIKKVMKYDRKNYKEKIENKTK